MNEKISAQPNSPEEKFDYLNTHKGAERLESDIENADDLDKLSKLVKELRFQIGVDIERKGTKYDEGFVDGLEKTIIEIDKIIDGTEYNIEYITERAGIRNRAEELTGFSTDQTRN